MSRLDRLASQKTEELATALIRNLWVQLLDYLPSANAATTLGESIGDGLAAQINSEILPELYDRHLSGPDLFTSEKYEAFIQSLPRTIVEPFDTGIPLVGIVTLTVNVRRVVRGAIPEFEFTRIQTQTIDPLTDGVEGAAGPKIEKRITNLAGLSFASGAIAGTVSAVLLPKLVSVLRKV